MKFSASPLVHASGIHRRLFTQALLGGALGASVVMAQSPSDLSKVTLLINDSSALTHLPVLLAEHLGYFKAEGVSVDILDQASTVMSVESLSGGGLLAWSAPFDHVLAMPRHPGSWVSIMKTGRTPQLALGINRNTPAFFKRMPDLAGRRVGVLDLDSHARRCVDYAMVLAGGSPASLNYLALGAPAAALALRNGSLDAVCAPDPLMTLLEKKADIEVVRNWRAIKDSQRLFAGAMPGNCLIVSQAMLTQHPKICQSLVFGVARALKWLRTAGPTDLLRHMLDNPMFVDRAIYLNAVDNMREGFATDGVMSKEAAQTALRLRNVLEPQFKQARSELAPPYTNEFAMQARKRFAL